MSLGTASLSHVTLEKSGKLDLVDCVFFGGGVS